jgi:hypothetical protein
VFFLLRTPSVHETLVRYDLQVDGLPQNADQSALAEPTRLHFALVDAMEKGLSVREISLKLAPGDKTKQKTWRDRIRRMLAHDPLLARAIVMRAQSNLLQAVPGTTVAVGKRAQRGRMDAAKTVLEATGVHNPRVKHEHSGNIKITLDMPRPAFGSVDDDGNVLDD